MPMHTQMICCNFHTCLPIQTQKSFIISKDKASMRLIRNTLKDCHDALAFTIEEEENITLPFLDVKVIIRHDGTLATSFHQKTTWTGQYLNFHSFVPISMKRNLVRNLAMRIKK